MFECLGRPNAGPNLIFDIFQFFFMPRLENQWLFKLHPNTGLGPILLEVGEILPISIKEVVQNLVYACASHAMVLFSPPPLLVVYLCRRWCRAAAFAFSSLFQLKHCKKQIWPVFRVRSTQMPVKIYNTLKFLSNNKIHLVNLFVLSWYSHCTLLCYFSITLCGNWQFGLESGLRVLIRDRWKALFVRYRRYVIEGTLWTLTSLTSLTLGTLGTLWTFARTLTSLRSTVPYSYPILT